MTTFTALGSNLDHAFAELHARIASLERKVADLEAEQSAQGRIVRDLDEGLGVLRRTVTRHRNLAKEADLGLYTTVATEYTRFVHHDLPDLVADVRARQPKDRDGTASPEKREAETARTLVDALLLTDPEPDHKALTRLLGKSAELDEVIARAAKLRAQIAEYGAHFDLLAEDDVPSDDLRLWPGCKPGAVEFVVAPALMHGDRRVGDHDGAPVGPWVYTRPTRR